MEKVKIEVGMAFRIPNDDYESVWTAVERTTLGVVWQHQKVYAFTPFETALREPKPGDKKPLSNVVPFRRR